jgi:hypothetical protein
MSLHWLKNAFALKPANPDVGLGEQRRVTVLDKLARGVAERKLGMPAILALEMHKPIRGLGAQAMHVLSPTVSPILEMFLGYDDFDALARLLEHPDNVEYLVARIEQLTAERKETSHAGVT